jgi:predicted metal-dependent phosphoesterase TrpH
MNLVAKRGLKVIAVTDHDSTEGLEEAFAAAKSFPQLTLIPGIELSTDVPGNEIHVLGYFIRHADGELQETLRKFRQGRLHRAKGMVEKLRELGIMIEWERVQEIAGDASLGRPHIALAMVEKGYIREPREAFDKYLGRNGTAYVEREKLTPREAVTLIRSWGGAAVLAHPAQISGLDETLEELKQAGMAGIEAYYAQYSAETMQDLVDAALRHDLLPCGGSDYHALGNSGEPLPGTAGPPLETVERLEQRARDRTWARQ